jgi:hypothetical protein
MKYLTSCQNGIYDSKSWALCAMQSYHIQTLGSFQGLYISYMHTQLVEGQIQGSLICPMDEELEMK